MYSFMSLGIFLCNGTANNQPGIAPASPYIFRCLAVPLLAEALKWPTLVDNLGFPNQVSALRLQLGPARALAPCGSTCPTRPSLRLMRSVFPRRRMTGHLRRNGSFVSTTGLLAGPMAALEVEFPPSRVAAEPDAGGK